MTAKENQALQDALLEDSRLSQYTETHLRNVLSRIYIANFQGIKEMKIENLPLDARWVFLTGENGFGKTSILRAIAKGFVGDENFVLPIPDDAFIVLNGFIDNKILSEKYPINAA